MMNENSLHISLTCIDFLVPHADSLKAKRRVIKSLKDKLRARFNASVAEIGYLEEWQRATIGITMISNEKQHLQRGHSAINRMFEEKADIQILNIHLEWL